MKQIILLAVMILVIGSANSQPFILDSAKLATDSPNQISGSGFVTPLNADTVTHDTIPVIMLVCDTTKRRTVFFDVGKPGDYYDRAVWWLKGYSYQKTYNRFVDSESINLNGFDYIFPGIIEVSESLYLDKNKHPLNPDIIVWMSKPLNQPQ